MELKFSKGKIIGHIVAYVLLFLAGDLLNSLVFDLLFSIVELPIWVVYSVLRMLGCLIFTYLLFWLYTVKILRLQMESFRITLSIKKWALLYAVILPFFVVICYFIIGDSTMTALNTGEIIAAVIYSAIAALKAGVLEEMLFRGYILKFLELKWGKVVAVLIPSFLFSLMHIPSMDEFSVAGILLLVISGTLVGIMFSLITYKGNSISNSSLLHAVWNFVFVTDMIHITTAQGIYGEPVFSIIIPSDHVLVTGAGFGVEASIIAIIGYLSVCGVVILRKSDEYYFQLIWELLKNCVLNPSDKTFEDFKMMIQESYDFAKEKFIKRKRWLKRRIFGRYRKCVWKERKNHAGICPQYLYAGISGRRLPL